MRQFADQVLLHCRDTYGKPPTPLFVDGINVDTLEPVRWKWADGKEWVLQLAGQQGVFRTLDGFSRLTGEPRYKDAALEALRYAFDHLRYGTQNGGLLAWAGTWSTTPRTTLSSATPMAAAGFISQVLLPALRADVGGRSPGHSAGH